MACLLSARFAVALVKQIAGPVFLSRRFNLSSVFPCGNTCLMTVGVVKNAVNLYLTGIGR
ncbi:hypothetical protein CFter6_2611 [Collimonas fungivorans]|uniref:Uncharacterized protein n=1 Tax=Collimonas fungivorans TaxID=158899 RepID=A0A127PBT2_9BURK|nr:hypothetical protein CFter6_2611 [Collimonas fungivorans]